MANTAPAPVKKALPFKRTKPHRPVSAGLGSATNGAKAAGADDSDDDDGLALFQRSSEFFPVALEERERDARMRREKEQLKKKEDVEKERRLSLSAADRVDPVEHDAKRRRTSFGRNNDGDDDLDHDREANTSTEPIRRRKSHTTSKSPPSSTFSHKRKSSSAFLSDGDDDDVIMDVKGKGKEVIRKLSFRTPRKAMPEPIPAPIDEEDSLVELFASSKQTMRPASSQARSAAGIVEFDHRPILITGLDDDDDEIQIVEPEPEPEVEEAVDPEFQEYIDRARQREAQRTAVKQSTNAVNVNTDSDNSSAGGQKPSSRTDPEYRILVDSDLPGSSSIMAVTTMTRSMKKVRLAFIAQQEKKGHPLSEKEKSELFLTFKDRKIYDSTTGFTLGLEENVSRSGHFRPDLKGSLNADSSQIYVKGGIQLRAWTDELWAEHEKNRERERLRVLGHIDDDEYGGNAQKGDDEETEVDLNNRIRVTLKARDMESLPMSIHPENLVSHIVKTFRKMRKIGPEKSVTISFDGEALDEAALICDTEIEDLDNLEVHIK